MGKVNEKTMTAAIAAFNKGTYKSIRATATAFSINYSTLHGRIKGRATITESRESQRKLTNIQEERLTQLIIDLEATGQAVSHQRLRDTASFIAYLNGRDGYIGKKWAKRYITRTPAIKTKMGKAIDYRRV